MQASTDSPVYLYRTLPQKDISIHCPTPPRPRPILYSLRNHPDNSFIHIHLQPGHDYLHCIIARAPITGVIKSIASSQVHCSIVRLLVLVLFLCLISIRPRGSNRLRTKAEDECQRTIRRGKLGGIAAQSFAARTTDVDMPECQLSLEPMLRWYQSSLLQCLPPPAFGHRPNQHHHLPRTRL